MREALKPIVERDKRSNSGHGVIVICPQCGEWEGMSAKAVKFGGKRRPLYCRYCNCRYDWGVEQNVKEECQTI